MSVTIRERGTKKGRQLWADLVHNTHRRKADLPGCILTGDAALDKVTRARANQIAAELFAAFVETIEHPPTESLVIREKTLEFVCTAYVNRSADIAPNTKRLNESSLKNIYKYLSTLPHDQQLTQQDLSHFSWPNCENWLIENIGKPTARLIYTHVRGWYNFAFRKEWLTAIPKDLRSENRQGEIEHHPLSPAEVKALLDSKTLTDDKVLRAFVIIMIHTGLRVGDMCSLTWDNIQDGILKFRMQKTKRWLTLPLNKFAKQEFEYMRTIQPAPGIPVFPDVTKMKHRIKRLRTLTGIPVHPHGLRHTCAVNLLRAGVGIYDVSRYLGHESVKTTEKTYSKWIPERQQAACEALERVFDQE